MTHTHTHTVCFLIPVLGSGGAERIVSILSNHLLKTYNVIIITLVNDPIFYSIHKDIKIFHCNTIYSPSKNTIEAIRHNNRNLKKIRRILNKEEVNLTIAFTPTVNILAALASKRLKIPSILCERSNSNTRYINRFWKLLRFWSYKMSNTLVVQTQTNKEFFTSFIDPEKIKILPNSLSKELLVKKDTTIAKENIILNVGRLDLNKAQDVLIKAFSNIKNHQDWKLVLVGDGIERENYKKLVTSLHLEDRVIFVGQTKDVHKYYNTAKIFAFTSQSEGFPNALIEAMYFQLACVSSDCPSGPSEIIKDNHNGFLFPINDQKELEEKLRLLIDDQVLREKFSRNAIDSTRKFEPLHALKEWEKLIAHSLETSTL